LTDIGEFEFTVLDEWGQGIPLTESMTGIITTGLTMASIMAVLKDVLEEVVR
jgi:glutamate/tyrosine decarboxylase-like PLP-dependent enzyme